MISLFASVPVDKALGLVSDFRSSNEPLSSRTSLDVPDIRIGLEHCFSCKNFFFKQIYGTAMGSCISPIIASIYTEHNEHTAITAFHTPPSLWLRYVDDTFCILNKDHINNCHSHLNSICSHIHFTVEMDTIVLFRFLMLWLNAIVTMIVSLVTAFYQPQFTESPLTQTDIFTIRHITPIIRSSLLSKLLSQIKCRSTVNYGTYAVHCD